ncbi:MAG: hypothetical protein HQL38_06280 [Alphaproteobacteria bacterium]|nr:hypothetical protein [Alphaproteobacteria bacterium]
MRTRVVLPAMAVALMAAAVVVLVARPEIAGRLHDSARQALSGATPAALAPRHHILYWHAGDDTPRRARVDAGRHELFVQAVGRAMTADRSRMTQLLSERLRLELKPLREAVERRVPRYAESVFDWWTSYVLVVEGLMAVGEMAGVADSATLESQVAGRMAGWLARHYNESVLQAEGVQVQIRETVTRVFGGLRRDLLRDCDKYDQAFQDFIRQEASAIELLAVDGSWQGDHGWSAPAATFRSQCHTLRLGDDGAMLLDERVLDVLAQPPAGLIKAAADLTRPLAELVVEAGRDADSSARSLVETGLPSSLAASSATLWTVGKWAAPLAGKVRERLGGDAGAATFQASSQAATAAAWTLFEERLVDSFGQFLDAHLESLSVLLVPRGKT